MASWLVSSLTALKSLLAFFNIVEHYQRWRERQQDIQAGMDRAELETSRKIDVKIMEGIEAKERLDPSIEAILNDPHNRNNK